MKKVQYDEFPSKLEAVGNGSWRYRWDIQAITETNPDETEKTMYHCFEVIVWNTPSADTVIQAVIAAKWPPTMEAKLINDYNASKINVLSEDFQQPYLSFLNERKVIKSEIKEYFNEIV